MLLVIARINERKRELAQHPFLLFLANREVDPAERMAFAPCLAPFVMGFSDVNVFGLRDEGSNDQLQKLVNVHSYEDAEHWPMYLDDLETLGCNAPTDLVSVLRTLWSDECSRTRRLTYGLMNLVGLAAPAQRIALVEAIEATGFVAWKGFLKAATDYTAATGRELRYFGPEHAAMETGHAIGADDIDRELREITFADDDREHVLAMVDSVFALFAGMMDEQLQYARSHRSPSPAAQ